jgi:hypothetical protein
VRRAMLRMGFKVEKVRGIRYAHPHVRGSTILAGAYCIIGVSDYHQGVPQPIVCGCSIRNDCTCISLEHHLEQQQSLM